MNELSKLSFLQYHLHPSCTFGTTWPIANLDIDVEVETRRTMFPVRYSVSALIEAAAVVWVSVKSCGFSFAEILVLWNQIENALGYRFHI